MGRCLVQWQGRREGTESRSESKALNEQRDFLPPVHADGASAARGLGPAGYAELRSRDRHLADVFVCSDIVGRALRPRNSGIVVWNRAQSLTRVNSRTPSLESEVCSHYIDKLRVCGQVRSKRSVRSTARDVCGVVEYEVVFHLGVHRSCGNLDPLVARIGFV